MCKAHRNSIVLESVLGECTRQSCWMSDVFVYTSLKLCSYRTFLYIIYSVDSIREIMKYQKIDTAQMDLKNNPQAETMAHMRLFRAQRNLYISGFSLFLLMLVEFMDELDGCRYQGQWRERGWGCFKPPSLFSKL